MVTEVSRLLDALDEEINSSIASMQQRQKGGQQTGHACGDFVNCPPFGFWAIALVGSGTARGG